MTGKMAGQVAVDWHPAAAGWSGKKQQRCYLMRPFMPAGKKPPLAGLTVAEPEMAPPLVTMLSTWVVLRLNAMTLA